MSAEDMIAVRGLRPSAVTRPAWRGVAWRGRQAPGVRREPGCQAFTGNPSRPRHRATEG